MLRVVQNEQTALPEQRGGQKLPRRPLRVLRQLKRAGNRGKDERWVLKRGERNPSDAIRKELGRFSRRLQRQPSLARSTGPGERDKPRLVASEEVADRRQLLLATDECCRRNRQIRAVERLERWKLALAELPDPFRCRKILEAVLAQVAQATTTDERLGRRRHEDLSTVTGRCDPRRPMYVLPDVSLLGQQGRPRMHPHANPNLTDLESFCRLRRSRQRTGSSRKRHEERVSLGVYFDPAVVYERLTEQPPVLREHFCVAFSAELVEQASRAFDIGEQERDGAGR